MKKNILKTTIISLSASVAIASMAWAADVPKLDALDYVPADTAIFSGSLEPFAFKQYLELNKGLANEKSLDQMDDMLEGKTSSDKFVEAIFKSYYTNLANPDEFIKKFGVAENMRLLSYTVGLTPVLKYEASDSTAIWAVLDEAAKDAGVATEQHEMDGVTYKSYRLIDEDNAANDLIVAATGDWVTITLSHVDGENAHLKVALGLEKPQKSLNDTAILQDMADKYGFETAQLAYVDHKILANRITQDNPMFDLPAFNTDACRAELTTIAEAWPRIALGLTKFNLTDAAYYARARTIIESTNAETNALMMSLRGVIPAHLGTNKDAVYSLALGTNVASLATTLSSLWSPLVEANYECAPLADVQSVIADYDPSDYGLFAGMAAGINGISATIFDADVDVQGGMPSFNDMDLLISLASENPASLLLMASMMMPSLASLQVPDDGTPVKLNDAVPSVNMIGGETFAANVGKFLNVYSGLNAAEVSKNMLTDNGSKQGFLSIQMQYAKIMKLASGLSELTDQAVPEQMANLTANDMNIGTEIDFSEHGIELISVIDIKK